MKPDTLALRRALRHLLRLGNGAGSLLALWEVAVWFAHALGRVVG